MSLRSLILIALTLTHFQAGAWSQNGHRIIGKIADNHLTAETRNAISPLLQGDKLAEVTTWADEMRSNPEPFWQKESGKWHYINIASADEFKPHHYHLSATEGEVTDIYAGILKATAVLKSANTSLKDKQFYFRFLTHLVGDIHQPMHAGRSEDWGGNKIKVKFFGKETNLHSLWDKDLVESENLSYSEFAEFIDTNDAKLISTYLASEPKDWVLESFHLAQGLYDIGNGEFKYHYVYEQMPVIKQRLLQGGIRLAGLLNHIFDESAHAKAATK
ncbi:S1/P1 nuclease [Pseudoalteromonas spongiae]|uniref:S1/P1 nuclease n=1 Tax=Pseudoalteromonas spongiae TaxID=298657 RepID=UPI000C2D1EAA|nr:S1/P1 nuclease [Pseudoalteromonas spongiae]